MRRYRKGLAVFFLLIFLQETFAPTVTLALTGGPSQPEVESFEPVGTNQMVDLSTGDFNYNIPLMVVPGPNGGYPINLAYHAGIGMEQEASWVGLGWNINPGAITRNMRGVPDDFSGDEIKKTTSLKKDVTVGLGINMASLAGTNQEVLGFSSANPGVPTFGMLHVYYNNYRGVGYNLSTNSSSLSFTKIFSEVDSKTGKGITGSLAFSFDSQSGLAMYPCLGIGKYVKDSDNNWNQKGSFSVGMGIHSRQGLQSLDFQAVGRGRKLRIGKYGGGIVGRSTTWGGISFVNHTYVPAQNNSLTGTNLNLRFSYSIPNAPGNFPKNLQVSGMVITNAIKDKQRDMATYGTLYLENQASLDNAGTDYNRVTDINIYNDAGVHKNSVHMGVPVMTSDIYVISGQGIGGSFRAHRNDIGTLYEPGNVSYNDNIIAGAELGLSAGAGHIGVDAGYGYHKSYNGKWTDGMDQLGSLEFSPRSYAEPLSEQFYFKVAGEQTANRTNEWDYMNGEEPVAFALGMKWEDISPKPVVKSNLINSSSAIGQRPNYDRVKRIQNIEFKTKDELVDHEFYSNRQAFIFSPAADSAAYFSQSPAQLDHEAMAGASANDGAHHLHEYSVLSPDGTRYTYGLPAYNNLQREKVFANTTGVSAYAELDLNTYDTTSDASITNDEGMDHYFSETEIPAYVHSHMITQITSADYVDLTGDGPSEDDFGFYTKFNYAQVANYQWREPYYDANYIKGYYSNEEDDKAAYTYGIKNLYYVQSIETKTHIAVFYLGDRRDGRGVSSQNQKSNSSKGAVQKYLKKIVLYSKNDPNYGTPEDMIPLQTVFFQYSYELCDGVYNNDGLSPDDAKHFVGGNDGGKLTLKKVYIMYNGNEKGRLSPYEFVYDDANNMNYSKLNVDRWGNYQEAAFSFENGVNPYTRQDLSDSAHNSNAAAWCMTQINLPSGGEINIDYESDTYGHVQDKRAMQMCEILGFSEIGETTAPVGLPERLKMTKNNLRLWFKMDQTLMAGSEKEALATDYVEGIEEIYFKVFEGLVPEEGIYLDRDYVVGYAKIDQGVEHSGGSDGNDAYGYVDLQNVTYQSVGGLANFETHPFRKAGWQYIRYQRPDLFYNQADADNTLGEDVMDNVMGILGSFGTAISDALSILAGGYYNKAALLGYSKFMDTNKRSFVRLNCPDKLKYGGGHRVKTLTVQDNWVEGAREFGTEYEYNTTAGQTSGVADYEPIVGGEENCLKKPIWYNNNDATLSFAHIDAYLETPLNEAVYPGPRVVYGRVVQKNLTDANVKESQSGITVNEFYTAKDFPVYEEWTELETTQGYDFPLYIPFVGLQTFQNHGYSQGYSVVLNNMSGQPKTVATYPYREGEVSGQPISKIEYIYQTDAPGRLNNTVTVLDNHGVTRTAIIGVEQDFVIHEEESNSFSLNSGCEINVDLPIPQPAVPIVPSFIPNFNYAEDMYRGITTNKIIYKTGILSEVKAYSDGSLVTTKNLLYDAETGEALLTKVNNEWDKPVYNYNYAAHWSYDGMDGAYKNYRAAVKINGSGGSLKLVSPTGSEISADQYLQLGDEIQIHNGSVYKTYYVTSINATANTFSLENADGTDSGTITNKIGNISRSGHRNQQAVKCGTVISLLTDFLSASSSEFSQQFMMFNSLISGGDPNQGVTNSNYVDLDDMSTQAYTWEFDDYKLPNYYDCEQTLGDRYTILRVEGAPVIESEVTVDAVIRFNIGDLCRFDIKFTDEENPFDLGYIFPVVSAGQISWSEQLVDFKIVGETFDMNGITNDLEVMYLPTGEIFNAKWCLAGTSNYYEGDLSEYCFRTCDIPGVLHADATVYTDEWGEFYPYIDLGDPTNGSVELSAGTLNEYRYGQRGIYRPQTTFLYQVDRHQTDAAPDFQTQIDTDGMYESWKPFNWQNVAININWDWVAEITRYSPYGFVLEEKSRMSTNILSGSDIPLYSSQLYGFDNALVVATSGNASYFEIGYNSFEDPSAGFSSGHLQLTTTGGSLATTAAKSHTGSRSVQVVNSQEIEFEINAWDTGLHELQGQNGKMYVVSVWVNVESPGSSATLSDGVKTVDTDNPDDVGEVIDGWKKLELTFTMGASLKNITYTSTGTTYIDDLRFGPYNGGMMTYVFDPYKLWLLAELDALNYATFYNYDDEGKLIQVKKETEKGVITVQTSRSNIKQTP